MRLPPRTLPVLLFAGVLAVIFPVLAKSAGTERAGAGGATTEDEVAKGREISTRHCGRCHDVAPERGFGGIGSTPSFRLLMSLADGEYRFVTFFERRPHGVFVRLEGVEPLTPLPPNAAEVPMSAADLDAVLAYVRTLKEGPD